MKTKLIVLFFFISMVVYSQQFYREIQDPMGMYMRNNIAQDTNHYAFITGKLIDAGGISSLTTVFDETYTYPYYGWVWADNDSLAAIALGLTSISNEFTAYYSNFEVTIDTTNKIPTIRFMKEWVLQTLT